MESAWLETLARREVRDFEGTVWHIRTARAHNVPGALEMSCLIFDAQKVCRRFWSYPERWAELADGSLLALMDRPKQK